MVPFLPLPRGLRIEGARHLALLYSGLARLPNEELHIVLLDKLYGHLFNFRAANGNHRVLPVPDLRKLAEFIAGFSPYSVVMIHNHPSGDLTYSGEDLTGTLLFQDELLDFYIEIADHLIVGGEPGKFVSFMHDGVLPDPFAETREVKRMRAKIADIISRTVEPGKLQNMLRAVEQC